HLRRPTILAIAATLAYASVSAAIAAAIDEEQRMSAFEAAARTIAAGPAQKLFDVLPKSSHAGTLTSTKYSDANGNYVELVPIFFERQWSCLSFVTSMTGNEVHEGKWSEVRLYRLEPAPATYTAQTESGHKREVRATDGKSVMRSSKDQYLADFYE